MNTLLSNLIQKQLHDWDIFSSSVKKIVDSEFEKPFDIFGCQGCLSSFFILEFFEKNKAKWLQNLKYSLSGYSSKAVPGAAGEFTSGASDVVIVVPGERVAGFFKGDLLTVFGYVDVTVIPNW